MSNKYIKESCIFVETQIKDNLTVIKNSSFTAPLKIIRPFYDNENNIMKLCIMNISPGMLEGDIYKYDFVVGEGTRMNLYSQSYGKIFTMSDGCAEQHLKVVMKKNSYLEYYMQPTIPYKKSSFKGYSEFYLEESSRIIYREILSCGRYKMGEKFAFDEYSSLVKIYYKNKLLLLDNTVLQPLGQPIEHMGFYEGFTHVANLFIVGYGVIEDDRIKLNEELSHYENISYGISLSCENCLIIRILGNNSDYLCKITENIRKLNL